MPLTDNDFILFVGPNGKFGNADNYTSKQDIDALVQRIQSSEKKSVSIHFHGGLVSRSNGLNGARVFAESLENVESYPVCFIWETDILSVLKERLLTINESTFFRKMLLKALKKFAERYVPAIDSRGSKQNISEEWILEEMSKEIPFASWNYQREVSGRGLVLNNEYERRETVVIGEIRDELEREFDRDSEITALIEKYNSIDEDPTASRSILSFTSTIISIAKVVWRVIKRFHYERDHGFYPTVVEEVLREFYIGEIGSEVWDLMKLKAMNMWKRSDNNDYVASYFIDSLIKNISNTPELKVNLIGHSAGATAILHGYKAFFERNCTHLFKELIFIAPACRFDLADEVINKASSVQGRWSLFALSDDREQADVMIPILYPISLLYFISGLLEKQGEGYDEFIVGMERFWKDNPVFMQDQTINKVKQQFLTVPNGVAFAPTLNGRQGGRTNGYEHGEIDNELNTVESIKFLITN